MTIESDGMYYKMNDKGWISGEHVTGSDSWRITGAVTLNNFGRETCRYTLADILADPSAIPWKHKNGKQKTHLTDFDHGTGRLWGSPGHRVM